jgi:hypothetical protein
MITPLKFRESLVDVVCAEGINDVLRRGYTGAGRLSGCLGLVWVLKDYAVCNFKLGGISL